MATKITKSQKFAMLKEIPAVAENPMLVEFIDHEIDLLSRKNSSGSGTLTKTQKENEVIKTAILNGMDAERLYTITEIQKEVDGCAELTNQKISALMRQLVDAGQVERTEVKRKAHFQKIVEG